MSTSAHSKAEGRSRSRGVRYPSLKRSLSAPRISGRRTTIANAFAAAIAATDIYDDALARSAMEQLGQPVDGILRCIYCDGVATTWDHLIPVVKAGETSGPGHRLGNLVPCCSPCNSRKGGRDWTVFLEQTITDEARRSDLRTRIERHRELCVVDAHAVDVEAELRRLHRIRELIFRLMKHADHVAAVIRDKRSTASSTIASEADH